MTTYDHDVIAKAIAFSVENHKGMVRKGTEISYIVHPMETAVIVATMTPDSNVIAAAVLHDVLEDTKVTAEILAEEFNQTICDLVAEESEDKRENMPAVETWRLRKKETIDKLALASKEAKIVTLGDKLSNIRAIHRDLKKIGENLWGRFNQKDPALQGWYYQSILTVLEDMCEEQAYQEYKVLVEEVFSRYNK